MSGDQYNGAILLRMPRRNRNNPSLSALRYTEDNTYLQNFDQQYEPSKYSDGSAFKSNRKNDHNGRLTQTTGAFDSSRRCESRNTILLEQTAELNDIVREIYFGIFGGDYRSYRENEGADLGSKLLSAKTVLKRCQNKIAQLVEEQHIAFAERISAEEKPSIQECMGTWKKIYLNMQDDLDAAKNKLEHLMYRNEELRERNLELEDILVDSDEETSDSDDTSKSLQEQ